MKAARPDGCERETMTNIPNLFRITALVAVFVSIPLTLRAIGDYISPASSPEMNVRPNVTSEEVFLKDMGSLHFEYAPPSINQPSPNDYAEMKKILRLPDTPAEAETRRAQEAAVKEAEKKAEKEFRETKKKQEDDTFARFRNQRIEFIRARALKSSIAYGALLVVALAVFLRFPVHQLSEHPGEGV